MLSPSIGIQAVDWFCRMNIGKSTREERIEFFEWLKRSPRHVRETLALNELDALMREAVSQQLSREAAGVFGESLRDEAEPSAGIVLAAVVTPVRPTPNGVLVEAVSLPWLRLVTMLERDPVAIHCLHWRMWEEIVAGAYDREGYEVELTPRSKDGGRDIIATRSDIGTIRILDQVKAFSPGHLVTADDVRAFFGTINLELNVSKGFITTTSRFAPGVYKDERLARFMPYRLELRGRDELLAWLSKVKTGK